MFGLTHNVLVDTTAVMYAIENKVLFVIACLGVTPVIPWIKKKLPRREALTIYSAAKMIQWIILGMLVVFCVAKLKRMTYSPFIYFGF